MGSPEAGEGSLGLKNEVPPLSINYAEYPENDFGFGQKTKEMSALVYHLMVGKLLTVID